MPKEKIQFMLSYSRLDKEMVDEIDAALRHIPQIILHRDTIDIGPWQSIESYMKSASDMDFTVLLISDSYLKSSNCMYEVLRVMKDEKYEGKIFPAVAAKEIYGPLGRAKYVKYWQEECDKLETALKGISVQNLGSFPQDLKKMKNIAANVAEFLNMVADMNNPAMEDVVDAIKHKLCIAAGE